ncbi:MAG: hypothetical protein VYA53_04860, partial [Acidobacteriota bacterium]|nr:hypothetical protein [Acidobacteriota bacterium]
MQESEPEHVFLARENAVLRNYFRRQLANMGVFYNVSGRNNVPLVESLVDRRIDHFLLELQEKLSVLQSHVADMDSSQLAMAKAASSEEHLRPCLSWKTSIAVVEKYSGEIWNMLRYVFVQLEDRDDIKIKNGMASSNSILQERSMFL